MGPTDELESLWVLVIGGALALASISRPFLWFLQGCGQDVIHDREC